MMNVSKRLLIGFVLCLCASALQAEDWSRFRGPNGSGKSKSTLPVSWTPDANVSWKAELPGAGVSSPIVVGDRLFVTCYSGYGLERENPGEIEKLMRHLVCFDAKSGDKLWQKDIPAAQPEDPYTGIGVTAHGYASHTPVSDGKRVYVFFGKSGAFAFDMEGEQLWQKSLGMESDPWTWGSSSSPIVHDDILIVTASAESQAVVGLNAESGEEVWRQEAAGLDGMWGTPAIAKLEDGRTDLIMSVPKEVWGLDPATGKLRWFSEATGAEQSHSSPVVGGGIVFAVSGRGGGSVAIKAGGEGDTTETSVVWKGNDAGSFGSPIGYKSKLYFVASGVLSVIDGRSGKKVKQVRLAGGSTGGGRFGSLDYASPVIAGDKLYYTNGKGQTFVFDLASSTPKQLSVNLVTTAEESFGGTPAITDGNMFLRSNKNLYCVTDSGASVEPNASSELIAKNEPAENAGGGGGGRFGGPGGRPGGGGGPRGGGGGRGFDPAGFFNGLDKDSDGKITAAELEGSRMADRFAEMDKDSDGGVTLEEFQGSMRTMFGGGGGGGRRGGGGGGRGGFGGGDKEDNRPKRPQRPSLTSAN